MTTTPIVAGYVRVSSTRQRDASDSPASQRQRLTAAGCTRIYEDLAVSGYQLAQRRKAAAFRRLLADIRAGRIARLLTVRLDRVARRDQIVLELAELCDARGVEFATLSGGTINVSTASGWLQLKINSVFGEHYSRMLSESILAGLDGLHQAGIPARASTCLPFHLQRQEGTRHGVVPSPHWDHARHAVTALLAGEMTAADVGRYLRQTCGRWGLSKDTLRWLRSPAVAGHMARQDGTVVLRDVWPALVNPDEHQRLLAILDATKGRRPASGQPPKLLTGICRCALCQGAMSCELVRRPSGTYRYLRCRRPTCNTKTVAVGPIWDEITRQLDLHIEALVQQRALEAGTVQEPVEVSTWRRELAAREAMPGELRQRADELRIVELRGLIATAEAMPEAAEDWWPDGLAAGSVQFWSQRSESEINADLRRIIRWVLVDPGSSTVVETAWLH